MAKKIIQRQTVSIEKINKVFTDREAARSAFWEGFNLFERQSERNTKILNYYGVGGIGKTSLLFQIAKEMDDKLSDHSFHIYFDLEVISDWNAILERIKTILSSQYKFKFPNYEFVNYLRLRKSGEMQDKEKKAKFFSSHTTLDFLSELSESITDNALFSTIINIGGKFAETFVQKNSTFVNDFSTLSLQKLDDYIIEIFANDLNENIQKSSSSLVIMLDTYESMVNELKGRYQKINEEWLAGINGLASKTAGVFWVIAGREMLKWNSSWNDSITYHAIGNLSENDSCYYLENAGITSTELRKDLFKLSAGTPIYLSLSVDHYHLLKSQGIEPQISLFGNNFDELIFLFEKRMDREQQELLYLLACLRFWNDKMLTTIAKTSLDSFSRTTYIQLKTFSFIDKKEDCTYSLHKTISNVLLKHKEPEFIELKQRCIKASTDFINKSLNTSNIYDSEFEYWITWFTMFITRTQESSRDVEIAFHQNLFTHWKEMVDRGHYNAAIKIISILADKKEWNNSYYEANNLCKSSYVLSKMGLTLECINDAHKAIELYKSGTENFEKCAYESLDVLRNNIGLCREAALLMMLHLDAQVAVFGYKDKKVQQNLWNIDYRLERYKLSNRISEEEYLNNIKLVDNHRHLQKTTYDTFFKNVSINSDSLDIDLISLMSEHVRISRILALTDDFGTSIKESEDLAKNYFKPILNYLENTTIDENNLVIISRAISQIRESTLSLGISQPNNLMRLFEKQEMAIAQLIQKYDEVPTQEYIDVLVNISKNSLPKTTKTINNSLLDASTLLYGKDNPKCIGIAEQLYAHSSGDLRKKCLEILLPAARRNYEKQINDYGEQSEWTKIAAEELMKLLYAARAWVEYANIAELFFNPNKKIQEYNEKEVHSLSSLRYAYLQSNQIEKANEKLTLIKEINLNIAEKKWNGLRELKGNDDADTIAALFNVASAYANKEEYEKAIELYKKIHQQYTLQKYGHYDITGVLDVLAECYESNGDIDRAISTLRESIDMSDKANCLPDAQNNIKSLIRLYRSKGDEKSISDFFEKYPGSLNESFDA